MKIYLDVCCYSRLYDDQNQSRVHLEAEAILTILEYCRLNTWELVGSWTTNFEIQNNPNKELRKKVMALIKYAKEIVLVDGAVRERVRELESIGFKTMDAYHLACAEKAEVDVLLTTDDKFLKRALKEAEKIKIKVANPMQWLLEKGTEE